MSMRLTKLTLNAKGFPDLFAQWADKDGAGRAERVAANQRANAPVESGAYRDSIAVHRVEHPTRPVFQIGPSVDYGMEVEANHGTVARSLDAAGGA